MLKLVIALGLVASVSAVPSPDAVIQWLQEHGAEVIETAEECLAVGDAIAKFEESCKVQDSTGERLAGLAVWGLVEGMEASECPVAKELANTSIAKAAKAMGVAAVQESTREQLDSFCGKAQCMDLLQQFGAAYAQCYGRSMCAGLAHADLLAYEDCKPIMTSFVEKHTAMQSRSACTKERRSSYYCCEEQTDLLLKDPGCYMTLFNIAGDQDFCEEHADCVNMWKGAEKEYPTCSRVIAHQAHSSVQASLEMAKALYSKAKDPAMREAAKSLPSSIPLFLESCHDDMTINV